MRRNEKLIKHKLWQYLLPGIMLTAALQIGNIVDTMLVGSLLGADAMSAVKIGMAVDNLMEIPGYVLGVGGSVAVGILLGKRDRENANRVFSATFLVSLLMGLCFAASSPLAPTLADILTDGNSLVVDVSRFVTVTLLGAPVLSIALQFINYVAVDNNPSIASVYVISANVINLTFDYLLLKYTSLGTAGAALSTILGYGLSMLILVAYLKSDKRMLRFVNPFAAFGTALISALSMGLPTLLFMIFETVKDMALNSIVIRLISNEAMAVYTVCANITLMLELLVGGIIGTVASIGSVLYGEEDHFGLRVLTKYVTIYGYAVLMVLLMMLYTIPQVVIGLFGISGDQMGITVAALQIFSLSLPLYLLNKLMITYYQSTEKTILSGLITSMQSCIVILPVVFLFVFIGKRLVLNLLNALVTAFIFSELLTALIAFVYRKLKYKGQGFLLLPDNSDEISLDISVDNTMEQVEMVPREIKQFCQNNEIDKSKANLIAVAAEEMAVNIITYGGKKANAVDLNLCLKDNALLLRLRDNGLPFDPTEYKQESKEFKIHGIELVKSMANQISYTRTLDFNNTVIRVNL